MILKRHLPRQFRGYHSVQKHVSKQRFRQRLSYKNRESTPAKQFRKVLWAEVKNNKENEQFSYINGGPLLPIMPLGIAAHLYTLEIMIDYCLPSTKISPRPFHKEGRVSTETGLFKHF